MPPPPPHIPHKKKSKLVGILISVAFVLLITGGGVSSYLSYKLGLQDGYTQGYHNGYGQGQNRGYAQGNTEGLRIGYNQGYTQGQSDQITTDSHINATSYSNGFGDGYKSGKNYAECWVMRNHPVVYSLYFNGAFDSAQC